jgi:hypothetical protein
MFKPRKLILMAFINYEVNGKIKNHLDSHNPEAECKEFNRRQSNNTQLMCSDARQKGGGMGRAAQGKKKGKGGGEGGHGLSPAEAERSRSLNSI